MLTVFLTVNFTLTNFLGGREREREREEREREREREREMKYKEEKGYKNIK